DVRRNVERRRKFPALSVKDHSVVAWVVVAIAANCVEQHSSEQFALFVQGRESVPCTPPANFVGERHIGASHIASCLGALQAQNSVRACIEFSKERTVAEHLSIEPPYEEELARACTHELRLGNIDSRGGRRLHPRVLAKR